VPNTSTQEQEKQIAYRDARFSDNYDSIWQNVGKCVYCDLNDKYVFYEENGVVMTINLFAYIDGHLLIVPRRHVKSPKDLTSREWDTVRKFAYIAKKLVKSVHGAEGMQIVQKDGANAQSTVTDHVHFQCIPFDSPDLCKWNYRKLTYTPLENANLYKQARSKIMSAERKYQEKYQHPSSVSVVCDLIIVSRDGEVLFQERHDADSLSPSTLSLPGGSVDDFNSSLESELAREIKEETGLDLDTSKISLFASRLSTLGYARRSIPLKVKYTHRTRVLWNTYILRDFDPSAKLTPGDDCREFVWIPLNEIAGHGNLSPDMKSTFRSLTE
jgi:diadenosine tetraphosphate (Ap4A) HIT family hydrolase/8-oxo-dGTP pyrophosphatase MutT (NUDIX family)